MSSIQFITKCPFCDNNSFITWHHVGCPSYYGQEIDIKGKISCDCGDSFHILDCEFDCGNHGDQYREFTRKNQIRKIAIMVGKMKNCTSNFEDTLVDNVLDEWDRRH